MHFKLIVIGVSAGALDALPKILGQLPRNFSIPIVIVCHVAANNNGTLTKILNSTSTIPLKEIEDKLPISAHYIAICPANYHCYIEDRGYFSLSVDQKLNGCRPSIDCLFQSAADVFGRYTLGILLTGANSDGVQGLKAIQEAKGCTIVQDPTTAEASYMPQRAIDNVNVDFVYDLQGIADFLIALNLMN